MSNFPGGSSSGGSNPFDNLAGRGPSQTFPGSYNPRGSSVPGGGYMPGGGGGGGAAVPSGVFDVKRLEKIAPIIMEIVGRLFGGSGGRSSSSMQMTPEMRQLFNLQIGRMQEQGPLFTSVNNMAMRLLPVWARHGIPAPSPNPNTNPNPNPGPNPKFPPPPDKPGGDDDRMPGGWQPPMI